MSFAHRSKAALLAAALTLVAAGGLAVVPSTTAQAVAVVRGSGTTWNPVRTNITRGGQVRWAAVSGTHQVKAFGGNWTFTSRMLSPGHTTTPRTFNTRGTFKFFCTIHGSVTNGVCHGMCGRIVVS
jgi:plastocyanin